MARILKLIGAISLALCMAQAAGAQAASLKPIGNFDQPIYVTSDPINPDRLFVVEREGRIELAQNGQVTTFADLTGLVGCAPGGCTGERGLMSIALAPDFAQSGRLYVDYADNSTGTIHIDELTAGSGGIDPLSRRPVLSIAHAEDTTHYGGQLQFGPDGYLYISTGDGGGANDQYHHAQDLNSLLGKILRIDPRPGETLSYRVPPGNPFPAAAGEPRAIVWNLGLRNPFRFSFDRLGGAMTIGDVGQSAREEIDYAPAPGLGAGADYGWNCREGTTAGTVADDLPPGECATTSFVKPAFDYPHFGGSCSGAIVGGYVERDQSVTDLYGRYVYGDYCSGAIRSLNLSNPAGSDRPEGLNLANLDSFGEDSCGRLYAISAKGPVMRVAGQAPASCAPPAATPLRRAAFIGLRAAHRKVERHRKIQITAWVSPCQGRRGQRVRLLRGGRPVGTARLNVACTAHFLPRIGRATVFRASIAEDTTYLAATSRRVKIRIARHRHRAG